MVKSVKLNALYQRSIAQGQNEEVHRAGLANYQTDYILDTGRSTKNIRAFTAARHSRRSRTDRPYLGDSIFDIRGDRRAGLQSHRALGHACERFWSTGRAVAIPSEGQAADPGASCNVSQTGPMIDWLLGGFFSDEQTLIRQQITAQAVNGATAGTIFKYDQPINLREYAVFADPTVKLSDKFSVQFGGR